MAENCGFAIACKPISTVAESAVFRSVAMVSCASVTLAAFTTFAIAAGTDFPEISASAFITPAS